MVTNFGSHSFVTPSQRGYQASRFLDEEYRLTVPVERGRGKQLPFAKLLQEAHWPHDYCAQCRIKWHSLPLNNKKLLATWLVKIKWENMLVSKNSFFCSEHFEKECFSKSYTGQKVIINRASFLWSLPFGFLFGETEYCRNRV